MQYIALFIAFVVVYTILKCVRIVPQKQAFIVERLGKYHCTLDAGLHLLVPIIDRVSYKHTLKEQAIDSQNSHC